MQNNRNELQIKYLACPYSDPDPSMRDYRFSIATRFAAKMMRQGDVVFSPLTHGHPMACVVELPTDWGFWEKYCTAFICASQEVVVLQLEGWRESVGVKAELALADKLNIPIRYVTEAEILETLHEHPTSRV